MSPEAVNIGEKRQWNAKVKPNLSMIHIKDRPEIRASLCGEQEH